MFFELFVGVRYLRAKRKQAFISVITVISMLAVMLGVMALVVVLSVMNGFKEELTSKIMGVHAHLLVLNREGDFNNYERTAAIVGEVEGVEAATPFIYIQGIANHSGNVSEAVLRGIDPESVLNVLNIESMVKSGSLASIQEGCNGLPSIVIGDELSKKIKARVGDTLTLITSLHGSVRTRRYGISALLHSGVYDYDVRLGYISLQEAQNLLGIGGRVSGLEVRVNDIYRADTIAEEVQKRLGYPYLAKDWKTMNRSVFSMLKLQKITFFIILTMIVLVGALNIISTMVMVVMEKTKDIAILRAIGASARSIMAVFILQGLMVGVAGTLTGLASGLGICRLLERYKFITLPSDVYALSNLPVKVDATDVFIVAMVALGISFIATIYPAWSASKQNPTEAIRYG